MIHLKAEGLMTEYTANWFPAHTGNTQKYPCRVSFNLFSSVTVTSLTDMAVYITIFGVRVQRGKVSKIKIKVDLIGKREELHFFIIFGVPVTMPPLSSASVYKLLYELLAVSAQKCLHRSVCTAGHYISRPI